MKHHVLLLVNSYVTDADPRHGAKFRLHLRSFAKRQWRVGVVTVSQRGYRTVECLKNGGIILRKEFERPIVQDCMCFSCLDKIRFASSLYMYGAFPIRAYKKYIAMYGAPDIIHAHGSLWAGRIALAIKKRFGAPYVVTEHMNTIAMDAIPLFFTSLVKETMAEAEMRMPISAIAGRAIEEKIGGCFVPWEPVPNMYDDALFFYDSSIAPPAQPVFFSASALLPKKGFGVLLQAFASVFANGKETLRIAGDGPERRALASLASELGIAEQVVFLGNVSRQGVAREMQNASAYVCSSRFETFGIPVIEAMACGKPIVTTQCGGPEELVTETSGRVVPKDDAPALAQAMQQIAENTDAYNPEAISEECRSRFSPGAVLDRLGELYNECAKLAHS